MVIEFARNICGLEQADSTEFNPGTPHRVIFKLRELKGIDDLGILRQLLRARRHLSGRGDWRPQRGWHTGSEPTTKTVRLPFCISFTTAFGNGGWAAP
jgi:CTP synthase (UTP-ammonia lyase)